MTTEYTYKEYLAGYANSKPHLAPPLSRPQWDKLQKSPHNRIVPRQTVEKCKHGWTSCAECEHNWGIVRTRAENSDQTNPKDLIGITKLPLRFIPPPALAFLSKVMELGAVKYGPFNWRTKKVKATVYYEAALRHILSAMDGEELDPESGQPHSAHVMACMAILLDAKATDNLVNDLFEPGVFGKLVQTMQTGDKK